MRDVIAEDEDIFTAVDGLVQEYRRAAARLAPEHSHQVLLELDSLVRAADRARRTRVGSDMEEARNALEQARRCLADARMRGTAASE